MHTLHPCVCVCACTPGASSAGASSGGADAPCITAYDAFSAPLLADFAEACTKLGAPEYAKCSELVSKAWALQRTFLATASKCKKPANQADEMALMKPIMEVVQEANKSVQRDDFEFHFKAVQEGMASLNWLVMPSDVRDFIEAQIGSMDYSGNKIRLKFKRNTDKFDENQHKFVDSLKKLVAGLIPYTKEHHFRCVTWNPRGGDMSSFTPPPAPTPSASSSSSSSASAKPESSDTGPGIGDLKNALGKFQDGAKGLKKVSKDMQTWREEFKGDTAAAPAPVKKKVAPRPVVNKTKGDKKVEYQSRGMRWCVEAQAKDDGVVEVAVADVKHSVNIYGCWQATINITGKIKGVVIDSCEQCKVLLDTAISSVELVNCKRMQIQVHTWRIAMHVCSLCVRGLRHHHGGVWCHPMPV